MKSLISLTLVAPLMVSAASAQTSDISMFPAPRAGMERHVIRMPPRANEEQLKVEFRVGKTQLVDCNRHFRRDNIRSMDLPGWGYHYWVVADGPVLSTMMGCPDQPRRSAFVSGSTKTESYNSRLPIVIYAPKGLEVRYILWSVTGPESFATRG